MKIVVRYYSRTGNTKAYAEAIAKGAGVNAVSVDAVDAPITEPVDTLFLGGGLYAYGIDSHLKDYIAKLDAKLVSKAVVFSTSWLSRPAGAFSHRRVFLCPFKSILGYVIKIQAVGMGTPADYRITELGNPVACAVDKVSRGRKGSSSRKEE